MFSRFPIHWKNHFGTGVIEDTTNGQWYGVLLGGRSTAYLKITILETEAADSSNGFKEVSVLVDNNSQYPLAMSN